VTGLISAMSIVVASRSRLDRLASTDEDRAEFASLDRTSEAHQKVYEARWCRCEAIITLRSSTLAKPDQVRRAADNEHRCRDRVRFAQARQRLLPSTSNGCYDMRRKVRLFHTSPMCIAASMTKRGGAMSLLNAVPHGGGRRG
jgi:hypothetical protein